MPTFTKETWVEVDVDVEAEDFDDEELIEELEDRGYKVINKNNLNKTDDNFELISWLLTLGKTEEALIQLERAIPSLKGIKDKIKNAGVV